MSSSTTYTMKIASILNPDHTYTATVRTSIDHSRQVQHLDPLGSSFTAGSMHIDGGPSSFVHDSRLGSQLPTELADRLDPIHSTSPKEYDSITKFAFIQDRLNFGQRWADIQTEFHKTFPAQKRPSCQALRSWYHRCVDRGIEPTFSSFTDEEVWFIWFHRVFFEKQWGGVSKSFNERFPKREMSSIRNRIYKKTKSVTLPSRNEVFLSFINRKGLIYPWMLEGCKPQAKFRFTSKSRTISCCYIPSGQIGHISNKLEYPKCSFDEEITQEHYRLLTSDLPGLDQSSSSYDEEVWFIWFHRVFFEKEWDGVWKSFNERFPERGPDTITRIQNDFSRNIKSDTIPCRCKVFRFFIEFKDLNYPWMLETLKKRRARSSFC